MPSATAPRTCEEYGADLTGFGECRDLFHAMLAMEWEIPGAAGGRAHFYAVASYQIQHPEASGLTAEALDGLRAAVRAALAGAPVSDLRQRATAGARRAGRVTRRAGEPVAAMTGVVWTTNVADVVRAGVDGYETRVEEWAESVLRDLDAAGL